VSWTGQFWAWQQWWDTLVFAIQRRNKLEWKTSLNPWANRIKSGTSPSSKYSSPCRRRFFDSRGSNSPRFEGKWIAYWQCKFQRQEFSTNQTEVKLFLERRLERKKKAWTEEGIW